jgi:hypothetical protein
MQGSIQNNNNVIPYLYLTLLMQNITIIEI